MRHFPIFVALRDKRVVVSGAGEVAVAKLRLLLKTEARVEVFGPEPAQAVLDWAGSEDLIYHDRSVGACDVIGATLLYCANDDAAIDAGVAKMGAAAGVMTNVVDNLEASAFITPAIVDRDPVTVAIGTEGAAPVLARKIKADVEEMLPSSLGALARIGQAFRKRVEVLPMGRARRSFWSRFYFEKGPAGLENGQAEETLEALLDEALEAREDTGRVVLIGTGPGDAELLTRQAAAQLHEADVVIHDAAVSAGVLELARREALVIPADRANAQAEMIAQAKAGLTVARLTGGDGAGAFQREFGQLMQAGIAFEVLPGVSDGVAARAARLNRTTSFGSVIEGVA